MTRSSEVHTDRDLNVLIVTESYPPETYGGGEISCSLLAESLAATGVGVTVLTSRSDREGKIEERNGVKVIRRLKTGESRDRLLENLKRKIYLKKSIKEEIERISEDFDLIHFFNITSITELSVDKPTFATINSYINFCPKGNLFYKEEEVCKGCNFRKFIGCITNSEYVGNQKIGKSLRYNPAFWIALYSDYRKRRKRLDYVDNFFSLSEFISNRLKEAGVSQKNIVKVPNVPDIESLDKEGDFDLDEEGTVVTYVGVLTKIKGVDLLIRAFSQIDPEATLLVVGDGPERERLEEIADDDLKIKFLGEVEHRAIPSIYQQSDVIVVPSVWPEPLSRVLLEAAYFGKPIIATDVGGNPDIVEHGYNGLLFKPEVEDLSIKLKEVLDDEKIQKMGRNMKKFYEDNLSKSKVVDKIVETYLSHLRERN